MNFFYTNELNVQIVIALLKAHGIKRIIASPGTTNVTFVASIQQDPFFEIYSSVDERSAAYIACGMSAESGEPVVLSCTGATASRNYYPGLTEAYYRKLPILTITSTRDQSHIGHLNDQQLDRSIQPKDTVRYSAYIQSIKDEQDEWDCMIKTNKAILELFHHGGGPVHINLVTKYSRDYSIKHLPKIRKISRICINDEFPEIIQKKIAIYVGTHAKWSLELAAAVDAFCESHNAVVFCEPCSNYQGKYRVFYTLASNQPIPDENKEPDLLIHIGEVSAFTDSFAGCKEVWRVNEDGEIKDKLRKLSTVFEMSEEMFFKHYATQQKKDNSYLEKCLKRYQELMDKIPDLPFSNVWIAKVLHDKLPSGSILHLGILSSLRAWAYFGVPSTLDVNCNEGGFGIDGNLSSLLGASLVHPDKLYFGIVGDLSFFYDMNVIGNRHVGNNIRILIVNNGKGNEFRLYTNPARMFGDDTDKFISAAGHYGNKSREIIKHYAEDLGYEYFCAQNKEEFNAMYIHFITPDMTRLPMIFEVFTETEDENTALYAVNHLEITSNDRIKQNVKNVVGENLLRNIKKIIKN